MRSALSLLALTVPLAGSLTAAPLPSSFVASIDALVREDVSALRAKYEEAEKPEDRIARLESAAAIGREAGGAEGRAAAELLAEALWDADLVVQKRALELLADGQDPAVAGPEIGRRGRKYAVEANEVRAALMDALEGMKLDGDLLSDSKAERAKARKSLEDMKKSLDASKAMTERAKALGELHPVLVGALARFRDDTCVDALVDLLGEQYGASVQPEIDALLEHGTRPALLGVVTSIRNFDEGHSELESRIKKLKRERPGKKPNDRWADEVWERKENERIAKALDTAEKQLADVEAWADALVGKLHAFAERHELKTPPKKATSSPSWKSWGIREAKKLPESHTAAAEAAAGESGS